MAFNLRQYGIGVEEIHRNTSASELYEIALRREKGTSISDVGALLVYSGEKTGRSPKDKRIVRHPHSENNIDWGDINIELDEHVFMINRERAIDYLNTCARVFVVRCLCRLGSQLSNQSTDYLYASLSCLVYAKYAHQTHRRTTRQFWRARLCHL